MSWSRLVTIYFYYLTMIYFIAGMSYEEEDVCTKQIDLFRWGFVNKQETYAIKIHGMILLNIYIHV